MANNCLKYIILLIILDCTTLSLCFCDSSEMSIIPTAIPGLNTHGTSHTTLSSSTVNGMVFVKCYVKCLNDWDCDFGVICGNMCYLVTGNIFHSSAESYEQNGCIVLSVDNGCLNDGTYYAGMCHCPSGFTGLKCELTPPDYCQGRTWTNLFSVDQTGQMTLGDQSLLVESVKKGSNIKVMVHEGPQRTLYSIDNSGYFDHTEEVYARIIETLVYLNATPYRQRKEIFSTADISTWQLQLNSLTETVVNSPRTLEWYASSFHDTTPCLISEYNFTAVLGSSENCLATLEKGADLYLSGNLSVRAKVVDITSVSSNLHVHATDYLSHEFSEFDYTYKFINPSSREDIQKYSKGAGQYFIWSITNHMYEYGGVINYKTNWILDACWHAAYSHTSSGIAISGSKEYLEAAIRNGKPIRAIANGVASPLNDILIEGGIILGVMNEIFNQTEYQANRALRIRSSVATNGSIFSCSYLWESDLEFTSSVTTVEIQWFVESRSWIKVLSFNYIGQISFGTISQLYNVVVTAQSLRIVIEHYDLTIRAVDIRHVHISNSSYFVLDTAVQQTTSINGEGNYQCTQWAAFLDSTGFYQIVEWSTGSLLLQNLVGKTYGKLDIFYQAL